MNQGMPVIPEPGKWRHIQQSSRSAMAIQQVPGWSGTCEVLPQKLEREVVGGWKRG